VLGMDGALAAEAATLCHHRCLRSPSWKSEIEPSQYDRKIINAGGWSTRPNDRIVKWDMDKRSSPQSDSHMSIDEYLPSLSDNISLIS
jgi:hypothetical protein